MLFARKILRIAFPVVLFAAAAAGLFLLWGGQGGSLSYRDMACGFEERPENCLESIDDWNKGLAYYDSTLSATKDTLESLKSLLWNFWNIEFAGAGEAAVSRESILPLQVLQNRKSGCVGLSWLALMVAESRNIDMHAVLLPGHVYLQYGAHSDHRVNIEPNRRGYTYSDDEYREKYKTGKWTGFEFSPLSSRQFVGLAAFNMGNLFLENAPSKALKWYRVAEDLFPDYPGIKNNQGIAKNRLP